MNNNRSNQIENPETKEHIYRCPRKCPWKKNCFVCKVQGELPGDVVVLHKCVVSKEDIPVHLGQAR